MRLFRKLVKGKTVRNHCSTPPGHVAYTVITQKKDVKLRTTTTQCMMAPCMHDIGIFHLFA